MEALKGISSIMTTAAQAGTPDSYTLASAELVKVRNQARETLQALTAKDMRGIIAKIRHRNSLTESEKDFVTLWMVGDAESYIRQENNYQDWLTEFQRLSGLLKDYEGQRESIKGLASVQGLITDALRVAADIMKYLEEKERYERFSDFIRNGFDQSDADLLVRLLTAELESPDM